jgi:hypothetical protein
MPAIESLLVALVAPADLDEASPKRKSGALAEFERAMTDALAPDEKFKTVKPPGKLNVKITNVDGMEITAAAGKNSGEGADLSGGNPPVKAETGKKVSAGTDVNLDLNAPPVGVAAPMMVPFVPPPEPRAVAVEHFSAADKILDRPVISSDEGSRRAGPEAGVPTPTGRELFRGAATDLTDLNAAGKISDTANAANSAAEKVAEKNPAIVLTAAGRETVLRVDSATVALQEQGAPATPATEGTKVDGVMPPVARELVERENEFFSGDFKWRGETNQTAAKSGTRVASSPSAMKNSDKMEVLAGFAGQKLPDAGPVRLAPGLITRGHSDLPPKISEGVLGKIANEFITNFAGADTGAAGAAPEISAHALVLPSLAETRVQAVERTHDLVSLHALRLVEAQADALSVVLRPDAGTELSLQLRHRDGVVEAQAVLTAGDHELLSRNWAELQSRLELHGVKLSALGGEMNFNAGGNHFARQRSPEREAETENALAFAEFSVATGGATARSAGLHGWESWA